VKVIRLLQIGDVHFPEAEAAVHADLKDRAVAAALTAAVVPHTLQAVVRQMISVVEHEKPDGILICGDLTTRAQLDGYKRCVDYLNITLEIANPALWSQKVVHAVPGNHDVDRALCTPDGKAMFSKFDPLVAVWQAIRLPILPVGGVRSTTLDKGGCGLRIFSINSCIGCGEFRSLPGKILKELQSAFAAYHGSAPPDDAFSLIGEQLDTPAFLEEHVATLIQDLEHLPRTTAPLILAHHNVLPQAMPRIEIYTEVINGGLARSRLAACDRAVIYCHGHIHTDPIEIVSDAKTPAGMLIAVSAPELQKGFNLLDIAYGKSNTPIGCAVVPYRIEAHGGVTRGREIRIPLIRGLRRYDLDDLLKIIVAKSTGTYQRFQDISEAVKREIPTQPQTRTLADAMLEAEWLGLLELSHRDSEPQHWHIRRIGS
jgi:hypothetical protein